MRTESFVYLCATLAVLTVFATTHPADAAFVLFDDFETYNLNEDATPNSASITGLDQVADISNVTSPWDPRNNSGGSTERVDFGRIGENQFLAYGYEFGTRGAFRELGSGTVLNTNSAATYFLRFQVINDNVNHGFGLSDVPNPTNAASFARFETLVKLDSDGTVGDGDFILRIIDGGGGAGNWGSPHTLLTDTWYNVWMVMDQTTDTFDVYLNTSGSADAGDLIADDFDFRYGTTADLIRFWVVNGSGGAPAESSVLIDDIYYDLSGQNLIQPIPEPSTFLLAVIGLFGLTLYGWRRKR